MNKKKWIVFAAVGFSIFISVAAIGKKTQADNAESPQYIPPSEQRTGNAQAGYDYLINGDYIRSGLPFGLYKLLVGKDTSNQLGRSGRNAKIEYDFTMVKAPDGVDIVVPNCLQCHAQVFDGKLIIGLGNSMADFSMSMQTNSGYLKAVTGVMKLFSPMQYLAAEPAIRSLKTVGPYLQTEVRGVNPADRLAAVLAAHRNPESLEWSDSATLNIPSEVIPTDVPAWWMLKKKNAMFYNGFGRGDFATFLMLSNLLTVKDTTEAKEVSSHFGDVFAYIKSIKPPKYPYPVNSQLAATGKEIFIVTCARCHGDYGSESSYPNLLIPESIVQTDSMLYKSNYQNPQFVNWFNKSWYAKGKHAARLESYDGYIAPPLDGIWVTAPYLHNGSVPTLEALLNSKLRPVYWQRDFKHPEYDYDNIGWKYEEKQSAGNKKVYNTTLPGYGNYGHTFGDALSDDARKALIEYLKTL
ncbi:MAG TPA: hypothetical protein VG738_17725 [Chitinophagaceae bacterium]|nr:hypothetical protein [Chitinophagaceae bacterium]